MLASRHGAPDRIVGILESLMVQLAEARVHFKVPGARPKTAELFRDKSRMKDARRAAGRPVAKHALLTNESKGLAFAQKTGFPLVLKPPAGMGAKATFRVASVDELRRSILGIAA